MLRFAEPQYLHMLWLILVYVIAAWVLNTMQRKRLEARLGARQAQFLLASLSLRQRFWKVLLQGLALFFFVVAWARPQMGGRLQEVKSEGVELIYVVDVSSSMMAEDVKPSRLAVAKKELARLLDQLAGDKVGIVAFAGAAALVSPMTTDKSALHMFLDSLSEDTVSTQGTHFKNALAVAAEAFARGGVEVDETTRVTRALVIASDGEDNEEGALAAAKALADERNIRLFGLAIGTEKGAPIPVRDAYGNVTGYKKDADGNTVLSRNKGTILRELAEAGRGSFYHLVQGGDQVLRLRADLDKLEKTNFATDMATDYEERYQFFLLLGLICAFLDFLLLERKKAGRIWRGRFEVVK